MNPKAAWPRIKVTATFGGFGGTTNACRGCDHCGCCFGLCVEISRSSMVSSPLTPSEINSKIVLFDFIDDPINDKIILIPDHNVDNGDGWLHVDGNHSFSKEVSDYIGRDITLQYGSYEIIYLSGYTHGVIVINTL